MKREFRFKAKSLADGGWVEGDLLHRITDTCIAVKDMDDIAHYPIDPSTICQCTGAKDANGTMLYEHDVIHFKGYEPTAEIKWIDDAYAFMVEYDGNLDYLHNVLDVGKVERLRSIYDKEGSV